eukprot:2699991-Prymnesium_polylepis.1
MAKDGKKVKAATPPVTSPTDGSVPTKKRKVVAALADGVTKAKKVVKKVVKPAQVGASVQDEAVPKKRKLSAGDKPAKKTAKASPSSTAAVAASAAAPAAAPAAAASA